MDSTAQFRESHILISRCHILLPKCHFFAFLAILCRQEGSSRSRPIPKDEYACLRLRVRPSCTPRLEIGHISIKKCHILFRIDGFGRLWIRRGYLTLSLRFPHRISALYITSDAQRYFFGHILRKMSYFNQK